MPSWQKSARTGPVRTRSAERSSQPPGAASDSALLNASAAPTPCRTGNIMPPSRETIVKDIPSRLSHTDMAETGMNSLRNYGTCKAAHVTSAAMHWIWRIRVPSPSIMIIRAVRLATRAKYADADLPVIPVTVSSDTLRMSRPGCAGSQTAWKGRTLFLSLEGTDNSHKRVNGRALEAAIKNDCFQARPHVRMFRHRNALHPPGTSTICPVKIF